MAKKAKTPEPLLRPLPSIFRASRPLGQGIGSVGNDMHPHGRTSVGNDTRPHGMVPPGNDTEPHGGSLDDGSSTTAHGSPLRADYLRRLRGFGYAGALGYVRDPSDQRDHLFDKILKESSVARDAAGGGPLKWAPQGWAEAYERSGELRRAYARCKTAELESLDDEGKPTPDPTENDSEPRMELVAVRYAAALRAAFGTTKRNLLLKTPPPVPALGAGAAPAAANQLLERVDLRPFMSLIEDQGPLQSCTANAVTGLIDYLQIATTGKYLDGSRLFLYKTTRDLMRWTGDTGAYLRTTMKALALFGICPEDYYPYYVPAFDNQPDGFCFSLAAASKGISYYRLKNLVEIKRSLCQGYPVAFGFTCYESMDDPDVFNTGIIPYPTPEERTIGSHAVLAVGYIDRTKDIENSPDWRDNVSGYVIIRNSWGPNWGMDGYGLLPYEYFPDPEPKAGPDPLADDFWTLTKMQFVDLPGAHAAPYSMARWP